MTQEYTYTEQIIGETKSFGIMDIHHLEQPARRSSKLNKFKYVQKQIG